MELTVLCDQIKVRVASANIQIGNISSIVQGDILHTLFGMIGEIRSMCMYCQEPNTEILECILAYRDPESVKPSLHLSGVELGDRKLVVTRVVLDHDQSNEPPKRHRTVYICNLPKQMTENQLAQFLDRIGRVVYVNLCRVSYMPTGYAFVEFSSSREAQHALDLHGTRLDGAPIYVWSSKDNCPESRIHKIPQ